MIVTPPETGQSKRRERLKRGIYVLPSLFTVANIFCGFYSIVLSMRGDFELSAAMIFLAGVLDALDGRVARLTRTTSEFGMEFDSLADLVSFGLAPAFLAYLWGLSPLKRIGWLVAFLYVISAAMRLARFNIQKSADHRRYFVGMPVPAGAMISASCAYLFTERIEYKMPAAFFAALMILVTILMISRIKYRSFKDIDLRNRKSYIYIFFFAFALVAIAVEPKYTIFALSLSYLVSGMIPVIATYLKKIYSHSASSQRNEAQHREGGKLAEK